MADTQSADFTLQQKLDALLAAYNSGAITQAQYNTQYAILNAPPSPFTVETFWDRMFSVLNPLHWLQDLSNLFNIRILIIIALIGAAFFFGLRDRIPVFNLGPGSLQGKSFTIDLGPQADNEKLTLNQAGHLQLVDSKGKVLKNIRVKDIPELNQAIKPIGFQLKPIGVGGYGLGTSNSGPEVGAGLSWFKLYSLEADTFVTNRGFYPLGISHNLEKMGLKNTSIGLAGGIGFKGDKRVLLYVRIAF